MGVATKLVAVTVAVDGGFSSRSEPLPGLLPTMTAVADSTCRLNENITVPSEKALPAGFASKASQVGMTGDGHFLTI